MTTKIAAMTRLPPVALHKVKARAAALETVAIVTATVIRTFVSFCKIIIIKLLRHVNIFLYASCGVR